MSTHGMRPTGIADGWFSMDGKDSDMPHATKLKVTIEREGDDSQVIDSSGPPKLTPAAIIVTEIDGSDWILPFHSFQSAHIEPVENSGIIVCRHDA